MSMWLVVLIIMISSAGAGLRSTPMADHAAEMVEQIAIVGVLTTQRSAV